MCLFQRKKEKLAKIKKKKRQSELGQKGEKRNRFSPACFLSRSASSAGLFCLLVKCKNEKAERAKKKCVCVEGGEGSQKSSKRTSFFFFSLEGKKKRNHNFILKCEKLSLAFCLFPPPVFTSNQVRLFSLSLFPHAFNIPVHHIPFRHRSANNRVICLRVSRSETEGAIERSPPATKTCAPTLGRNFLFFNHRFEKKQINHGVQRHDPHLRPRAFDRAL